MSAIYAGPLCPSCNAPLEQQSLRSGPVECPYCGIEFEGTAFQPRDRRHDAVQIVTETPDGVAASCANHARNAAVTSCSRCGLFICALCDMNVGEGSLCPSCFDRSRDEKTSAGGATRYRDYATMAVSTALLSLLCSFMFVPLGPFAVHWGIKGVRQRREEGTGVTGPVIAIIIGVLQTIGWLVLVGMMVFSMLTEGK